MGLLLYRGEGPNVNALVSFKKIDS
jgi:hypothetical protein